jgi:predicted TIM-barrel fold metal-dependent hydrolase
VRKAGFSDVETAKILDYNARKLMPRLAAARA